jgi:hypothetical protein
MNPQLEAAWEIGQFLTRRGVTYAIIGGIAVQKWGEPRFTHDIDLLVDSRNLPAQSPSFPMYQSTFIIVPTSLWRHT